MLQYKPVYAKCCSPLSMKYLVHYNVTLAPQKEEHTKSNSCSTICKICSLMYYLHYKNNACTTEIIHALHCNTCSTKIDA